MAGPAGHTDEHAKRPGFLFAWRRAWRGRSPRMRMESFVPGLSVDLGPQPFLSGTTRRCPLHSRGKQGTPGGN